MGTKKDLERDLERVQTELDRACAVLTDVRDHGLVYWEPQTARGRIAKSEMLDRINSIL